jgi:membrane protein DedA with SNARE-associated domain
MVETFTNLLNWMQAIFFGGDHNGLLIIFALAVITDIGVPVPFVLDTVLILAAYKVFFEVNQNWLPVILMVLMLFVGRQIGSGILYGLARFLGGGFIGWVERHFPSVGKRLNSFCARPGRWAPLAVITGRLTPGLLQITSVAAGAVRLRYDYFAIGIALASIIYDGILILLGFFAAHSPKADDANFTFWLLIVLMVIVCILWPLLVVMVRRSSKKAAKLATASQDCHDK